MVEVDPAEVTEIRQAGLIAIKSRRINPDSQVFLKAGSVMKKSLNADVQSTEPPELGQAMVQRVR
jgi:hypothetical protein